MSLLARIFKRQEDPPTPAQVTVETEALPATTGTVPVLSPDPPEPEPAEREPAPPEPPAWMALEADVEPVVTAAAPQPEPQREAEAGPGAADCRPLDEAELERRLCALLDALGSAHRKPFVRNS